MTWSGDVKRSARALAKLFFDAGERFTANEGGPDPRPWDATSQVGVGLTLVALKITYALIQEGRLDPDGRPRTEAEFDEAFRRMAAACQAIADGPKESVN